MKKGLIIFISLISYVINTNSQTTALDSIIDEILFEEDNIELEIKQKKYYHFFYARTNYDYKTFYAGREIGTDQYNLSGQAYYFNSWGFYAGVSGAWYSQFEPKYSTTVLSAGIGKGLNKVKNVRYRLSYNYFLYNTTDEDFSPTYRSSANVGTTIKNKWIGTRLDFTFLIGQDIGTRISWDAYSKIKLFSWGLYNKIQLEPEVSLYFGSQSVYYEVNTNLYDYLYDDDYETTYTTEDEFGLMNTQLKLPLNISYKNFDFEVGYVYNIPRSLDSNYSYKKSSSFNVSLGYILNFGK
jgi:hypothetical protein